jgi:hypothetical protein
VANDKVTPRSSEFKAGARRRKPCFRYANPDRGDGALHWVPDDFPSFLGDKHRTIVDQLIMRLIGARNDLDDPARAPEARSLIDRVVQAIADFDPDSTIARHELIVRALDGSTAMATAPAYGPLGELVPSPFADLELRVFSAEATIRTALPSAKLPPGVVRRAVALWPDTKRREARTRAVRELARALDCDVPSLLTMLRQARSKLRNRRAASRRK